MRLAPSQTKRNTLAFALCLLAVLFAVEAKFAWYSPANNSVAGIQSEKARPADLPALVSQGFPDRSSVSLPPTLALFVAVTAIAWPVAFFLPGLAFDLSCLPVCAATYFSPGLFFRPPPKLQLL